MAMILIFFSLVSLALAKLDPQQLSVFQATFDVTYPQMTQGKVSGVLYYDFNQRSFQLNYNQQNLTETYYFNQNYGYSNTVHQKMFKVAASGSCSPCSSYSNNYALPLWWLTNTGPFVSPILLGIDPQNTLCTIYRSPSFATTFSLNTQTGDLCMFTTGDGRKFTINSITSLTVPEKIFDAPVGCKCIKPLDLVLSLDRSSSILTKSTIELNAFLNRFVRRFTYNPSDRYTTQIGIGQWGTRAYDLSFPGSLQMSMNAKNIYLAPSMQCNFCGGRPNNSACIYDVSATSLGWTCTSCGIVQATNILAGATPRNNVQKVMIVFTDGDSNTLYDTPDAGNRCCGGGDSSVSLSMPIQKSGPCQDSYQNYSIYPYRRKGCWADIRDATARAYEMFPDLKIFAVGIGQDISHETLEVISGDSKRTFTVNGYDQLASSIEDLLELTCEEPPFGNDCGETCCGFCVCGVCQIPDAPVASNLCDKVIQTGKCFGVVPNPLACINLDVCSNTICNRSNGGFCQTSPVECATPNPCFNYECNNASGCVRTTPIVCTEKCPCNNPCPFSCCGRGICTPGTAVGVPGVCTCTNSYDNQTDCCPIITPSPTAAPTEPQTQPPVDYPTAQPTSEPTRAPTVAPLPPCYNNAHPLVIFKSENHSAFRKTMLRFKLGSFCNGNGACVENECECVGNYTGDKCENPPFEPECVSNADCDDSNLCTNDVCENNTCSHSPLNCDDSNACTTDICDKLTGCVNIDNSVLCNDHNTCTKDSCDPITGACINTQISCAMFTDICNDAYCDETVANLSEQCIKSPIICPTDDNCTSSVCYLEGNSSVGYHPGGCENQTLDCDYSYAIIGGIAGGAVAGIIVGAGALLVLAAVTGGSAYAISTAKFAEVVPTVYNNPLYAPSGTATDVKLGAL